MKANKEKGRIPYVNRELSWLDFNGRVLEEAFEKENPIMERIRFLAITASNLDEFFMVRVAGVMEQVRSKYTAPDLSGLTPQALLDKLREQGLYEDTAIIITSDHGENMGELGIYEEHATADQPTCRIPFLIKWPGGQKGAADGQLHYSLDLLPTMAELLQVEPAGNWDCQSYAATIQSGAPRGRESLVISQMAHVCQRSARFGDWLYIRTIHDGYHLFDREMLFNVKEDPHEQHDRKAEHPELCAQGAKIILDWQEEQMKKSASQIDPMWTVVKEGGPFHARGHLEAYLRRLEATGRAEGARRLREEYGLK